MSVGHTNLQKLAHTGKLVAALSALLIVGYGIYLIAVPAEAAFLLQASVPGIVIMPTVPVVILAAVIAAVPALMFLYGLYLVWKIFDLAQKGDLYSGRGQRLFSRLGWLAIAGALCGVLVRTAVALLMTSANPAGQKMLVLGIDSGQILSIIAGILFFIFARILSEAAALTQENRGFV